MSVLTDVPSAAAVSLPRLSRRGRWRLMLALALVALGGAGALLWSRARPSNPPIRYETVAVTRGQLEARVTATGTLSALVTVQVGSQVSGRVQELRVDFNSAVRKGDLLARIDPRLFQLAVTQARANLLAAQANQERSAAATDEAERQHQRARALLPAGAVGQAEVDTAAGNARMARAQLLAAQANLAQARSALQQAHTNLAYTEIRSPIDGIVISRNVDVGQTVAASFQAPTLFVLAEDLARMQVDTSVAEADVGRLTPGMTARFTVDAHPGQTFVGRVRQVRNAPQTVQNVVTYNAVVDVPNPDLRLRPGMTANVRVVHAQRADALLVPNAALRFQPPASAATRAPGPAPEIRPQARTVWAVEAGQLRPVPLRLGVSDGTRTEVLEGALAPGDLLATDAQAPHRSSPGSFGRVF